MHILFDLARYQLLSVFISERFHLTTKYYHGNYRKGLNAVVLASNTLLLSCVNCVQRCGLFSGSGKMVLHYQLLYFHPEPFSGNTGEKVSDLKVN